jgi:LPS-assembly protein
MADMAAVTRKFWLGAVSAIALVHASAPIRAAADQSDTVPEKTLLQADRILADRASHIVRAEGHVEAAKGKQVIMADSISFDESTGEVTADGHVSLLAESGDVVSSEHVTLDRSFANGLATPIRLLMAANARLAAAQGARVNGTKTILDKVVFSPCNLCADNPTAAPLWQLRAARATRDEDAQTISYEDAQIEFYGIPLFYTPYLRHADPSAPRQSGFLIPTVGSSSDIGYKVTLPYLFVIDDSQDAVLAPTYATLAGYGLMGDYRRRFQRSVVELSGSFLEADKASGGSGQQIRGHVFAYGRADIADNWHAGFNLQRASDDTYLRRFAISNATTLTTSAYAERFSENSSLTVDNYWFQGLRAQDVAGDIPYVAPLIDYRHYGKPGFLGGRFDYQFNGLDLVRPTGLNVRRLGTTAQWILPLTTRLGELYKITARFDGNGYWVTNRITSSTATTNLARVVGTGAPALEAEWRWPLVKDNGAWHQVVEPIAQGVIAPYFGRFRRIPNQDSTSVEYDDTNLFSFSRYAGRDRLESGPRANIGGQWTLSHADGGEISALFGETFRMKPDRVLNREAGLGATQSDYVGRVVVSPNSYVDLITRVRLDRDTFAVRRSEIQVSGGPSFMRASFGYLDIEADKLDLTIPARRELRGNIYIKPLENYYVTASAQRNLIAPARWISYATGLFYTDECYDMGLTYQRSNATDRDIKPSTTVSVVLRLKGLGQTFELPNISVGSLVGIN